jgi:uncharacterized protein YegP (UPF0339 family)
MNLRITHYLDADGQHRWRAQDADNNRKVANCGEGYENHKDCMDEANALFVEEHNLTFAEE